MRYWYAFTPIVIVGTIFVLALPWLGLIAVLVAALVVLVALAALVWAIVSVTASVGHAVGRPLHGLRRTRPRAAPASLYVYAATRSPGYPMPHQWSSADISATRRDGSPDELLFREGRVS